MNEDFEKWFQENWKYIYAKFNLAYPMNSVVKDILKKAWNASRAAMKNEPVKEKRIENETNQISEEAGPDINW